MITPSISRMRVVTYVALALLLGSCAVRIHVSPPGVESINRLSPTCELTKWPILIESPKLDIPAYELAARTRPVEAASMLAAHIKELKILLKVHNQAVQELRKEYDDNCR